MFATQFLAVLAVVATGASSDLAAPHSMPVVLPQGAHPRVFLTQQEMEAMRARADAQEWARNVKESILAKASALVERPQEIPHEGGQWSHWYTCRDDGQTLTAESPTKHVCPSCGKAYSGPPYDQVYVARQHHHWLGGVDTLGLAYALDPSPKYAERVRSILLEYASFYASLPLHDVNNKPDRGAKLLAQTLDEAVIICQAMLGYDMVYDAPCFSQADHDAIRDGLLLPVANTIQANPRLISNWQSWHNAAVGCIGFVLGDAALVDWAINGKCGFLFQLQNSLTPSGMWYEECPSYHFYALNAHMYLMEAAAHAGMDLYGIPSVKGMFDAPLRQVLPDMTFVPFHDSDRISLEREAVFYDVAYRHYREPAYLPVITGRTAEWSLMWGTDAVPAPEAGAVTPVCSNAAGEGLAILRDPSNETILYLDYGPGRSGHVQPAKLGIALYAFGDIRFADPGRIAYGNPMHKEWFRQTIAHNTVVVNQQSQKVAPGKFKAFAAGEGYGLCRATCDTACDPPAPMDRTVLMYGSTIIDVFQCTAQEDSTFDLPIHFAGTLKDEPESTPVDTLGGENGYQHLKNIRKCQGKVKELAIDVGNGNTILVQFFGNAETYLAQGYGEGMKSMWPVIIRRTAGKQACFCAAYQMLKQGEAPVKVKLKPGKTATATVGNARLFLAGDTRLTINGKDCPIEQAQ